MAKQEQVSYNKKIFSARKYFLCPEKHSYSETIFLNQDDEVSDRNKFSCFEKIS